MPILFTLIGLILIVTGVQNTHRQFSHTLGNDLVGDDQHTGFIYWIAAIGFIGALGYVDQLKTISRLFLVLVLISMILANPTVFNEFNKAIKEGPIKPLTTDTAKDVNGLTVPQIEANVQKSTEAAKAKYGGLYMFFHELIGTKEAQ